MIYLDTLNIFELKLANFHLEPECCGVFSNSRGVVHELKYESECIFSLAIYCTKLIKADLTIS